MPSPTDYFVDPSIAGNSGAGTVGDPYGDLQHALDTVTRDSTNGDRFNIKAGTDEILASTLSLATYGTPAAGAGLILQGYTSAADDGGRGAIDCGSNALITAATPYLSLVDMEFHSWPTASQCFNLGDGLKVLNCKFDGTSDRRFGIEFDNYADIVGNEFIGFAGTTSTDYVIKHVGTLVRIEGNYISMGQGTAINAWNPCIIGNIIYISSASTSYGVYCNRTAQISRNSIFSDASNAGKAVYFPNNVGDRSVVTENLIEGFDDGIEAVSGNDWMLFSHNSFYDCTADITETDEHIGYDNESLGSSPFAKSGSNNFSNRLTYFEPNDVGSVLNGSIGGYANRGAVASAAGAGGGLLRVGMNGGMTS